MAQADTSRPAPQFTESLLEKMREELQPELGTSDAQMIRHITIAWLSEHGYLDADRGVDNGV